MFDRKRMESNKRSDDISAMHIATRFLCELDAYCEFRRQKLANRGTFADKRSNSCEAESSSARTSTVNLDVQTSAQLLSEQHKRTIVTETNTGRETKDLNQYAKQRRRKIMERYNPRFVNDTGMGK